MVSVYTMNNISQSQHSSLRTNTSAQKEAILTFNSRNCADADVDPKLKIEFKSIVIMSSDISYVTRFIMLYISQLK